jgi:SAM-dependent methyltransferase
VFAHWYESQVLPRIVDRACGTPDIAKYRRSVLEGLSGKVVEIGFGSGTNLGIYPDSVTEVAAVEPSDTAWQLSEQRRARSPFPVVRSGIDGGRLTLPTDACDAAVITFTLCTVGDPVAVLAEVARVVRPGGELRVLEHGLAPHHRVAAWQRRLDPLERRLAGGCHLTREPFDLVKAAGFDIVRCSSGYARGPRPWAWFTMIAAEVPSTR